MVKESKEVIYREYTSKFVPWLKEQIDKSPDKIVTARVEDTVKQMGPKFKEDISIYKDKDDIDIRALFELKYLLWPDGIVVSGSMISTGNVFTFRRTTPEDEPPTPGLIETIGEEDVWYVKHVDADVMSPSPFNIPDKYIKDDIESNVFYGRGDIGISVTKIGDFKKVKLELE